jgi:CheY-like chemotaxis protein
MGRRPGNGQHVLFIDDEEPLVALATRTLQYLGYVPHAFVRSDEAVAACRENPRQFDAVVTDLNMPSRSGLDVAAELRAIRPDIPIVLASGFISEDFRGRAARAGIRHFLLKPITIDDFGQILGQVFLRQ